MEPICVHPCVYVLKCEDDCFYVGISLHFNTRIAQHMGGRGSKWTRLHKPVTVDRVVIPATKKTEDDITLEYMRRYGWRKVRGGRWCQTDMKRPPAELSK